VSEQSIILFDGVCNLCNSSVNTIIDLDTKKRFRFSSLQSDKGIDILKRHQINATPETIILVQDGRVFQKSGAVLRICRSLIFPMPLLFIFIIIPAIIRDGVYDIVAANRYRWFGKKDQCRLPTPELKERFL
jgi:predicted DCC family thiol-disulfide oxidoreductase YuxK